ncbi:MAG: MBL fold metallo-hydrolase, partial [Pseudomonadota bacterium]
MKHDKRSFVGLCAKCAITAALAFGANAAERNIAKDYPLTKLTDHVYVIHGPNEMPSPKNQGFRNNPVIVITNAGVVVFDPGTSRYVGEMIVKKVKAISSLPIIAVFDSHIHGDHWLGNHGISDAYPNVVIYGHPRMKSRAEQGEGDMWIKAINQRTGGAIEGTQPVAPTTSVENGAVITLGGTSFRIHYGDNAHTDNDIMVEIVEERVLYFGDIVRQANIGPFLGSFKGNLAAINAGLATKSTIFIPGHGQSGGPEVAEEYRIFLQKLLATVTKL